MIDSGNWRPATNSFDLQQKAYSRYQRNSGKPITAISWLAYRYQLVGLPLSVICSECPIELDKPHILVLATETVFLLFKEQVPLK